MHHSCMLAYVLLSREGVNYIILYALWRRFSPIPRVYFSILVSAVVFHNNFITPHESQTKHLPKAHQFTLSLRLEAECHLNLERDWEPTSGGTAGIVSCFTYSQKTICSDASCSASTDPTTLPGRKLQTLRASNNWKNNSAFQWDCSA